MSIEQHWLTSAQHILSPNFDERADAADMTLIVIHCISLPPGESDTPYIDHLFCNQLDPSCHPYFEGIHQLTVSAHVLIKRSGHVVQYVPFDKRAWHAGKSIYQGRERCNDFSVGIELEGTGSLAYTDAQYQQLAQVVNALLQTYPTLSRQNITGHSDIAPERKTDPGASFDWPRFLALLT